MMDQFIVWKMAGIKYLCVRSDNPENYYYLDKIKRL
jgi:hypothetical protein